MHIVSLHNLDQNRSRSSSGSCQSYLLWLCCIRKISIRVIDSVVDLHKQSTRNNQNQEHFAVMRDSARLCETPADALVPLWCAGALERYEHSSASCPRWHSARRCTTSAPWPCTLFITCYYYFNYNIEQTCSSYYNSLQQSTSLSAFYRVCVRMFSYVFLMIHRSSWTFMDLHSNTKPHWCRLLSFDWTSSHFEGGHPEDLSTGTVEFATFRDNLEDKWVTMRGRKVSQIFKNDG